MPNKYYLYLLICLICLSIERSIDIIELKHFDQITINQQIYLTYLYFNLDGFDKGSKVHIKLEMGLNKNYYTVMGIKYRLSNNYTANDYMKFEFIEYKEKISDESKSSSIFYYTIKIPSKYNYLLIKLPDYICKQTITHFKVKNRAKIMIIIISIVVIILIIIAAIIYYDKNRKDKVLLIQRNYNNLPPQNNNNLPPQKYNNLTPKNYEQ